MIGCWMVPIPSSETKFANADLLSRIVTLQYLVLAPSQIPRQTWR